MDDFSAAIVLYTKGGQYHSKAWAYSPVQLKNLIAEAIRQGYQVRNVQSSHDLSFLTNNTAHSAR